MIPPPTLFFHFQISFHLDERAQNNSYISSVEQLPVPLFCFFFNVAHQKSQIYKQCDQHVLLMTFYITAA